MKLITGLFMAWGNFLTVPCPVKRWDGDLKNYMLGFLPTVGMVAGAIWAGLCLFLVWIGAPFLVIAFMMTFILFAVCGFLHLEGFMDCSDALLSRRPLEEKQRIMKDPHCGSFAVISACFMILAYYAFLSTALNVGIDFVDMCLIPIVSRTFAGLCVLFLKPIGHSQYAEGKGAEDEAQKKKAAALMLIQFVVYCGIGLFFATDRAATALVIGLSALVAVISVFITKRALGGMSGDIAGLGIVWGELAGIIAMLLD